MDKAAISVKASSISHIVDDQVRHQHIEAALTQAYEQGDKEGYKRGWYECKEAALKAYYKKPFGIEHIRSLRIEEE